jgi:hypothetical protein
MTYILPRTPLIGKLPPWGGLRPYILKGRGGGAPKCVDLAVFSAKSLIVERNAPTGLGCFSTSCVLASTVCPVLSTNAVFRFRPRLYLYLSLFKKKERRKDGLKMKNPIHGYEQLPKKEATGFKCHPRVFRGWSWVMFSNSSKGLSGDIEAIHASTACFASGYFERGEND